MKRRIGIWFSRGQGRLVTEFEINSTRVSRALFTLNRRYNSVIKQLCDIVVAVELNVNRITVTNVLLHTTAPYLCLYADLVRAI